jgi:UDP-glucose 4-epimerase
MMAGRHPVVWGDGSQTRDFIFVEDVARAFADALESNLPTINLNLGFGIEHTFNDVIRIASQQLGFAAQPQYIDVPIHIYAHRLWADMSLASKMLGFAPRVTLEEGIAKIIDYTKTLPPDVRKALEVQQMYFEKLSTAR